MSEKVFFDFVTNTCWRKNWLIIMYILLWIMVSWNGENSYLILRKISCVVFPPKLNILTFPFLFLWFHSATAKFIKPLCPSWTCEHCNATLTFLWGSLPFIFSSYIVYSQVLPTVHLGHLEVDIPCIFLGNSQPCVWILEYSLMLW